MKMDREEIKTREIMIAKNGKPLFAVRIDNAENGSDANYIYVDGGEINFATSWLRSIQPFQLGNESHKLAKEIFTIGVQAAIKTKIYELKQLESIIKDVNLADCLGNVMIDNTRLLLDMNENINAKTKQIEKIARNQIKFSEEVVNEGMTAAVKDLKENSVQVDDIKKAVETAIIDTVKPVVVKKQHKTIKGN